jgi:hypothetical protein
MNRHLPGFASAILLILLLALPSPGQTRQSQAWLLASLRGEWEVHTIRQRWTISFLNDHEALVNHVPVQYLLLPGGVRFEGEGEVTEYRMVLRDNSLSLSDADGHVRLYKRVGPGRAEHELSGRFYSAGGSDDVLTFDGDRTVRIALDSSEDIPAGRYRVEGETILICWKDGDPDEASIRYRDEDETVTGIIYDGRLFELELPIVAQDPSPIIVWYPRPDPFPSPPRPHPGGPHPTPPPRPPGVNPVVPPPANPPQEKHRDFGEGRTGTQKPR